MLMISVANLGSEKLLNDTDELNNRCVEKCEKSKDTKIEKNKEDFLFIIIIYSVGCRVMHLGVMINRHSYECCENNKK